MDEHELWKLSEEIFSMRGDLYDLRQELNEVKETLEDHENFFENLFSRWYAKCRGRKMRCYEIYSDGLIKITYEEGDYSIASEEFSFNEVVQEILGKD